MSTQAAQPGPPTHLDRWLRLDAAAKPAVYAQIAAGADLGDASYWLAIVFSSIIATLGLVLNSPAVIIGAMLISPLMSPIMATGLATAAGDMHLALRSIVTLLASIALAILCSASLVWLLPFHAPTAEILARTNPTLLDLAIAIASGLAGSVAAVRAGSSEDSAMALPGVAIAVALMPPLCTVGFGLGNGFDRATMGGAFLLFLTNLVAIVASAFLVFSFAGMRSAFALDGNATLPRRHPAGPMDRLLSSPFFGPEGFGGKLHFRALILLAMLLALIVPLKKSLTQVVSETRDRAAIQDAMKQLSLGQALVSQSVSLGNKEITVDLITTRQVSAEDIQTTTKWLEGRTGKDVHLNVTEVASRGDITDVMKRLADATRTPPPASPAPTPEAFSAHAADTRQLVAQKLQLVWPQDLAPLDSFDLTLTADRPAIAATYTGRHTLDPTAIAVIQSSLRRELNDPTLTLTAKHTLHPTTPK